MISTAVRREIDRILANKYPRSAIVSFGSPGVLEEETWNAIGVSAVVEGELRDPLFLTGLRDQAVRWNMTKGISQYRFL